jgi:hypothetical protein
MAAASVVSSMAQSNVYSLNVVGYVNVPTTGGGNFNMLANPLNNANNGITNLFAVAQDGDAIFTWDASIQDLGGTVYSYSSFLGKWDGNRNLAPGEGFFYLNAGSNKTNTFVGDVVQGAYNNPVPIVGGGSFNGIGSSVPIGGSFTNATDGIIPRDGDSVFTWDVVAQDLGAATASYSTFLGKWDNTAININPGNGFFYLGAGANQNPWTRNFTVP